MGGHHYSGSGIVIRGWGIAFHGWGSLLFVGSGACHLLWFERCGLSIIVWVVGICVGGGHRVVVRMCGGSCGWWGFAWVWAFT